MVAGARIGLASVRLWPDERHGLSSILRWRALQQSSAWCRPSGREDARRSVLADGALLADDRHVPEFIGVDPLANFEWQRSSLAHERLRNLIQCERNRCREYRSGWGSGSGSQWAGNDKRSFAGGFGRTPRGCGGLVPSSRAGRGRGSEPPKCEVGLGPRHGPKFGPASPSWRRHPWPTIVNPRTGVGGGQAVLRTAATDREHHAGRECPPSSDDGEGPAMVERTEKANGESGDGGMKRSTRGKGSRRGLEYNVSEVAAVKGLLLDPALDMERAFLVRGERNDNGDHRQEKEKEEKETLESIWGSRLGRVVADPVYDEGDDDDKDNGEEEEVGRRRIRCSEGEENLAGGPKRKAAEDADTTMKDDSNTFSARDGSVICSDGNNNRVRTGEGGVKEGGGVLRGPRMEVSMPVVAIDRAAAAEEEGEDRDKGRADGTKMQSSSSSSSAAAAGGGGGGGWFPYVDRFITRDGSVLCSSDIIRILDSFLVEERKETIRRVVKDRSYSLIPVVEGLSDIGNVAAVFRSAEAFGFQSVGVIADPECKVRYKKNRKVSKGVDKWLDVEVWNSTRGCLGALRARGYRIGVTHMMTDESKTLRLDQVDWTVPTAIILGNEHLGVSDEALAMADFRCGIPMGGFVESLNISVAAAILMYHAVQDRIARQGFHGDLTVDQRQIMTAEFYLRHKRETEDVVDRLLRQEREEILRRLLARKGGGGGGGGCGRPLFNSSLSSAAAERNTVV
ncbi:hypothetical protein CBR_g38172 [Chara braunii]|uniref:tRNA/rRNA methyltransferase SpoU type domain-containing protein n=1 Tax=Chara braunii TaxID=69332 RepID=A0A388LPJ8_CHABU|nr:hypothetical protein CBR_g38172 [Chara braunii]|eukprot:GBG84201.1 hypothetical protein CBR_g38172 [Chara braunii]